MERTRTVLVVEDFALVRDGLVSLLKTVPGLQVAGVASTVHDARSLLPKLVPDLLLTELLLDDGSAIELLRLVRRDRLATRVIVVTRLRDTFAVEEAMSAGVDGYVLKSQPATELFEAIQAVTSGRRYFSPASESRQVHATGSQPARSGLALLSAREIEILRLIASGKTSAELSAQLNISTKTIDTHRSNMYRKLSLLNRVDLVRFASMHGIGLTQTPPAAPMDGEAPPSRVYQLGASRSPR
jgi:DNA-binding NarL/FixJ family response regulator